MKLIQSKHFHLPFLQKIKDINFRKKYKNCAAVWLMEQALKGIRRRGVFFFCFIFGIKMLFHSHYLLLIEI
jgi:hypothetical protein